MMNGANGSSIARQRCPTHHCRQAGHLQVVRQTQPGKEVNEGSGEVVVVPPAELTRRVVPRKCVVVVVVS